jgi:glycerol uptake facilitator protein
VILDTFNSGTVFLSETVGTALLILMGCGVVAGVLLAHSKAQNSGWIVIAFGWGIGVMLGAGAVFDYGGGQLNPAVTLGVWANTGFSSAFGDKIPIYFAGQFCGAFIGATLVYLAYYLHWKDTEDPGLKLAVFSTGPAVRNYGWNLVTEIIGTFVLVFGIFTLLGNSGVVNSGVGGEGILFVGLLVVGIGLSLGGPTGYAINPARDLGPRIIHAILPIPGKGSSDWAYSWVPVVGPLIGGLLGGILHHALFPIA